MDDNTAIVFTILVIAAGIAATSWSRSWASRATDKFSAEKTRAQADLIKAESARDAWQEAQRRDLADAWDDGYETAARFHEGDEPEPRSNPYRAVR